MNKYLKGFLNTIIELAVGFVGAMFSWNILAFGFMFFPDIVIRTSQMLAETHGAGTISAILRFNIGLLPLTFITMALTLSVFVMFKAIKLMKNVDIEKILAFIKK